MDPRTPISGKPNDSSWLGSQLRSSSHPLEAATSAQPVKANLSLRWSCAQGTLHQGCIRREGGGSGTQKFVYQKWADEIFSIVNFFFAHHGHFGLGWGGGSGGSSSGCQPFSYIPALHNLINPSQVHPAVSLPLATACRSTPRRPSARGP